MMNDIIGLFFALVGVLHVIWTLSAGIRATKIQWPPHWPVSGRWVLFLYALSISLVFLDIARIRLTGADGTTWFSLSIRLLAVLGTLWVFWRWLSGNVMGPRDDFE